MSNTNEIHVCCAVIVDGARVFAARRGPNASHAMKWEFPGGKMEPGESEEACLHRELAEELNIKIRIVQRLQEVRYAYPGFRIVLIPFVCAIQGAPPKCSEHHEAGWFTCEELCSMNLTEADACLLPALSEIIGRDKPRLLI